MDKKEPERLTNEQYMGLHSSLRMYHHVLHNTVEIHWHEFYEMSFFLAGSGTHILNGTPHPLQEGSIFLLTPADFHEIVPHPGTPLELFNVIFSSEMLQEEVYQLLFNDLKDYRTVFTGTTFNIVATTFHRLWSEVNECHVGHQIVIHSLLACILVDLARNCMASHIGVEHSQQHLHNALVYIHHHFREALSLEEVAKQACLSPNYFSECFRKLCGTSFQGYLQGLRLQFALSLLSASKLSVTAICYASGFNTLSHFERAFKQKFGQSPRSFAASHATTTA